MALNWFHQWGNEYILNFQNVMLGSDQIFQFKFLYTMWK